METLQYIVEKIPFSKIQSAIFILGHTPDFIDESKVTDEH